MKLIFKIAGGIILGNFLYESSLLYAFSDDIRCWQIEKVRALYKKVAELNKNLRDDKKEEKEHKKTIYGKSEIGFKI